MPHATNIQVYLRFRPASIKEKQNSELTIWKITPTSVSLDQDQFLLCQESKKLLSTTKTYNFSNN